MLEAPTAFEYYKFENSESIEIENNQNQKYKLTIFNNSKYIKFYIEDLISFPKNEYILLTTLEELQKINRFFLVFRDTKETCQILINSSQKKNLYIIHDNNICKIKIINPINGEEFTFEVPKKDKDIKQEIQTNIIPLMIEMKNKINELEKDNKDLKQKIIVLEKKNEDLEKRLEILEKNGRINTQNQISLFNN